jgi:hypothetical protein
MTMAQAGHAVAVRSTREEAIEIGNMTIRNCPGCGSRQSEVFYELGGVPTNSRLLLPSREEAIALPRGNIALEFCGVCGLVFNAAFDPDLVAEPSTYEQAYTHSPIFVAFQRRLADQLIERYGLHGKEILEIGYGRGDLLALLCDLGANRGSGFYVGYPPDPWAHTDARFRREPFSEDIPIGPTDLVCSSMLLEYVADPVRSLELLRRPLSLRKGARLFLQVSNFVRTLRHFAFWEIHYAHCSCFTPGTLHRLLCAQGFSVSDIWTDFDGQYLMADSRAADDGAASCRPGATVETITELASLVARFAHECREKQALWCEILRRIAGAGNRIVIWGAGSSAAAFLTTLAVGDEVSYVVDPDPSRQGKYTPGTGHRIVAPDVMLARRPDVVIVMNSVLTFEIQEILAEAGSAPTMLIA